MAKKSDTTATTVELSAESIIKAYIELYLTEEKEPKSIFLLCKTMGISEREFYQFFTSFEHLEESIWEKNMESTLNTLMGDEQYANFSAREKMLTFFFSYFTNLLDYRSFALVKFNTSSKRDILIPKVLNKSKDRFKDFTKNIIIEAIGNEEVADRGKLSEQYDKFIWAQMLLLFAFWIKDNSRNFEQTDVAIEKSVNLFFDLIQKGALESALDFGKFIFQRITR